MKLVLPIGPSANAYKRHYCSVDHTHAVKAWLTAEAEVFREHAGWLAKAQRPGEDLIVGEVRLTIHVYRPRRVGDLDNYAKVVLDALNGIVWEDDKQIVELHMYRYEDKANPRLEILIEEIEEVPA